MKILSTIGPASLKEDIIQKMDKEGVDIFRINLSHTSINDLRKNIELIQSWTNTPICLDTEGAQIRNQNMINESVFFKKGENVNIYKDTIIGDESNISFYPPGVVDEFRKGDIIRVDFNSLTLEIVKKTEFGCIATILHSGTVGSNKAADVNRDIHLDPITEKDKESIKIGLEYGINIYSLSFTNTEKDVDEFRKIIGQESILISKIESRLGLINLKGILSKVDQILIDRGDLSREVPIEKIPFLQRKIISLANSYEIPVNVATNLLESMINVSSPTRAEVNDVVSTILMGADGLVLAAESAIGKHPVQSVQMLNSLIKQYRKWSTESSILEVLNS